VTRRGPYPSPFPPALSEEEADASARRRAAVGAPAHEAFGRSPPVRYLAWQVQRLVHPGGGPVVLNSTPVPFTAFAAINQQYVIADPVYEGVLGVTTDLPNPADAVVSLGFTVALNFGVGPVGTDAVQAATTDSLLFQQVILGPR